MDASSSGPPGSSLNVCFFGIENREFHSRARRIPYVIDIGNQVQLNIGYHVLMLP